MKRRILTLTIAIVLATAIPAAATEPTRDSYREAVEPICKANTTANERILGGVRQQVKQGKLDKAATQFDKAAKALKRAVTELKAVPSPAVDRARLARWLGIVGAEATLFERAGKKLKEGSKAAAQILVVRLTHEASVANNVVTPFEFDYCRFEPARFT